MPAVSIQFPAALDVPERHPYRIEGPARVLILSDIHTPYHSPEALALMAEWAVKWKPTYVLFNGDSVDFYAISAFERDPKKRDLQTELEGGFLLMTTLRKAFPRARFVLKGGNHEARWQRYLWTKAPEIAGVPCLSLPELLQLPRFKADFVPELTQVRLGKLVVIHGHEYRWAISNPVNPARGLFLRAKTSALCGHHHQRSTHSEADAMGHLISTWSTGCLCHLSPDFNPMNNWSHGFAAVEVGKDGAYDVDNLKIYKGKVYR